MTATDTSGPGPAEPHAVAADEQWHRLSPRMLLIHPVIEVGRAVPALLGLLVAGSANGAGLTWSLIGTAVVLFLSMSRWFTTRLRITAAQVQLRHGLFRRRTTSAPLDRVRTVDVTSHLMHRALGLARVAIGTGTSDRQGRGRLVLDGLPVEAAARLRADLLHRRTAVSAEPATGGVAAPAVHGTEQRPEYGPEHGPEHGPEQLIAVLDRRWVRYAPFTLSGALTAVVVYGFAVRLDREAHVNLLEEGPVRAAGRSLRHAPLVLGVVTVLLGVLVFVAIASVAGYVLAFWDFRLSRHRGGSLHVSRGLLTSRATSIERRRLAGVELSEPLLLRVVGGARTVAIATGLRARRGAERGGEVLLPPAPRPVAAAVASAVLDGARPFAVPLRPHPAAARRRRVMRATVGFVPAPVFFVVAHVAGGRPLALAVVGVGLMPLAVPLALDRYRSLGHELVDGYVVTRFGSLVRRHSAVSTSGVIGWNLRSTFFQRRAGLTTLTATTAAGKQRYRVVDLHARDAVAFADAALPGLLADFLVPAGDPAQVGVPLGVPLGDGIRRRR